MGRENNFIDEVNKLIGNKIYDLRLAKGLSREQLADDIGVSHQQLSKYERGKNRISVGRLILIAQALEQDVNYFLTGLEYKNSEPLVTQHQRMCLEVSRNFMGIRKPEHQEAVNTLVRTLKSA